MNAILKHIDLWTTAQTPKTSGRGNRADNQQLLGIQKLRELILELAVRGKLVPQDPTDEPASVLLKKIEAEKKRLIKEGKIKKQEVLPEIGEDEKPFDLPEGWKWVRLGKIFDIQDYKRVPVNNAEREKRIGQYPYYGANGQVGCIDDFLFEGERILLAEDGGFFNDPIRGVAYIVKGKFWVNNHAHVLNCLCGINPKFFTSFFNQMDWKPLVRGMTRDKLNQSVMLEIPIVLPPLAEQHRIVAKVDELMALCDQLEQQQTENNQLHQTLVETLLANLTQANSPTEQEEAWQRIANNFDTLFTTEYSIDQLKQTILQLAVMGKLVPQDPADEPASELLKKIAKEKARLVKEGKIKSESLLPSISEDEILYQVPDRWKWCRMQELCPNISSGSTPANQFFIEKGIPFLKVYNIRNQKIDFQFKQQFISQETHTTALKRSILCPGDVIMNIVGPPLGKIAIVPNDYEEWNCNQAIVFFKPTVRELNIWLYTFLCAGTFLNEIELIGTAGQDNISVTKSKNIMVPLPPLAEQHRIVAKVDELFALCDALKERLAQAQTTQNLLAGAVVERALVAKPEGKVVYATNEQMNVAAEPE